ncbi:tRNA lysidine(34) synthetase TilS [Pseudothauera rhizosphaerae]|uniref:tRNA(Ile)-lysidine synthase n=1 Tax=Pseudothauera rhizosphaerae TaxID=2565932 RepID=A0A4S4AJX8_9RHOO|nr:tRNA lysidine(34) synthetase TilS [Pseudothauera rhizosphaerae]
MLAAADVRPGARLCCALSGGVDSIVLLHALAELRPRFGYRLGAAHVHHGLSSNADAWADFCAGRCAALEVEFALFHVTVPRDDPEGTEAAARRVRHAALAGLACDWLVFGHHINDQAETVLFRLLRGTGLRGAGAMRDIEPAVGGASGRLRPLLGVGRGEILAWARARGLAWVEDESNADSRYARNALRLSVLPVIEAGFPAAVPALARAAAHFREAGDLLDELAALDEAACGGRRLERGALLALSDARLANLLRWQARRLGVAAPSRARLHEALRQLRTADARHPLYLALGEAACAVYRGRVWLERAAAGAAEPQDWHGELVLPWAGGVVRFEAAEGRGIARVALEHAAAVRLVGRRPGLRLRLHARRPERSFRKLCQEAGVPAWMRDRLPVLEIDGTVAWIGGIGVAAAFACTPGEAGIEPVW